jgi:hypothetical protein
VSRFLDDAAQIFDVAQSAVDSGSSAPLTILIGAGGAIQMIADSDWPLPSLALHHGAQSAYRITRNGGNVTVDGRSGGLTCRIGGETPATVARRLLNGPFHPVKDIPLLAR